MARRLPGLSSLWQEYLLCLLFHMILPLLPIGFEFWLTGEIDDKTLALATSMYSIAIGVSLKIKLIFGLTILISIIFAMVFGILTDQSASLANSKFLAGGAIATVFVIHAGERYNRHVVDGLPFWDFN